MKRVLAAAQAWLTKWGQLVTVAMVALVLIATAVNVASAREQAAADRRAACTAVKRDEDSLEKFLNRQIAKNNNGKPLDPATRAFLSDLHDTHTANQAECLGAK